jgi:predicted transcriptional regulator YdeE
VQQPVPEQWDRGLSRGARRTSFGNLLRRGENPQNSLEFRAGIWQSVARELPAKGLAHRREGPIAVPAAGRLMEPLTVTTDPFLVVGVKVRTTNRIEAVPQTAKIPAVWARFSAGDVSARIPQRIPDSGVIAVYTEYESDYRGAYALIVGHKVTTLDPTPPGMCGVSVASGPYLRFPLESATPKAIVAGWESIWRFFDFSPEHERAYTTDFELYEADRVEIYVATK